MAKSFAWSWSRLKNYRTCPKRHYHVDLAKDVKEEESEQLKWGNQLHDAMAKKIGGGIALPKSMPAKVADQARQLVEAGANIKVELKLAMDKEFQPTPWFGATTWFRGIVDVLGLNQEYAVAIDWKTGGKIEPDMEQLALNAQLIFAFEDVKTVHTAYYWTQHGEETVRSYTRDDMRPLWTKLLPEVAKMEQAAIDMNYPPTPSGLCKRYCPVRQCQYWGKGSR